MLQIDIDMPHCCNDCFAFCTEWGNEYRQFAEVCTILQKRFNVNALDINVHKQRLNDCPLKGVADE